MAAIEWRGSDLLLAVHVQPRAARDEVAGVHGDRLKIRITAPPVDGQANGHLTEFLAELCQVPRRDVVLLSGSTGREKRFRIHSPRRWPALVIGDDANPEGIGLEWTTQNQQCNESRGVKAKNRR